MQVCMYTYIQYIHMFDLFSCVYVHEAMNVYVSTSVSLHAHVHVAFVGGMEFTWRSLSSDRRDRFLLLLILKHVPRCLPISSLSPSPSLPLNKKSCAAPIFDCFGRPRWGPGLSNSADELNSSHFNCFSLLCLHTLETS